MRVDTSSVKETLLDERETAELLGISHSHLRHLRRNLRIGCYNFSGRYLYSERHISEFKQNSEQRVSAVAA
jgi:hypothetical protein